jgi:hypothetical protein
MPTTHETADAFMRALGSGTKKQRERLLRQAPWPALREAAVTHPDPEARFWLLFVLDHHANDASTATFAEALHDPSPKVRGMALHSIACEPCKADALCVADVVPSLINTLLHDDSPVLRLTSLKNLIHLAAKDARVVVALKRAAANDPDPVVRDSAAVAVTGGVPHPRKSYERNQRRHAASRPRR